VLTSLASEAKAKNFGERRQASADLVALAERLRQLR
jgi:hypothetical protein